MYLITIKGAVGEAIVFTDQLESTARLQLTELCDQPWTKDLQIRVMPDCHAGKGCVIGLTLPIIDSVVPNLVGVDIGCGMEVIKIKQQFLNLKKVDQIVHQKIPNGKQVRSKLHPYFAKLDLETLRCWDAIKEHEKRIGLSLGSLGSGNHFIEINQDEDETIYMVVHSGSRQLGTVVATHYQNIAIKQQPDVPPYLVFLTGEDMENYLHDLHIVQKYATLNRQAMMDDLINELGLTVVEQWTTIHNYIDENMMLRKGAIAAPKGEKVIIPLNMRDGSIIGIGKGNPDWNQSAPHGAGRLMSRQEAKLNLKLEQFESMMEGVYSTSISKQTLDESPLAYKDKSAILKHVNDTIEIIRIVKPIYNFKA